MLSSANISCIAWHQDWHQLLEWFFKVVFHLHVKYVYVLFHVSSAVVAQEVKQVTTCSGLA